ncbi:type VII secretion target [Kitasatospora sp. NPDC101155]|uniref:type VII secretion target n=1 Tax=Kitasatospora sp. NPDC101155 TaxID=3364097 RepID=UPI00382A963E
MSDRSTAFDRMMNPWAYDAEGNLTAQAQRQETARTRLDSADAPSGGGGGGFSVKLGELTAAATDAEQINCRLSGECQGADQKMAAVAGGLPGFGVGAACKEASTTWDKQIQALTKVIGGLAQNLRASVNNYQSTNSAAAAGFQG